MRRASANVNPALSCSRYVARGRRYIPAMALQMSSRASRGTWEGGWREVTPIRIHAFDQPYFLSPPPGLHLLLASDRLSNIGELFPINELRYFVLPNK